MLMPSDTESLVRQSLLERGMDFARPDPAAAWVDFKQFAEVPVECARDYLFFQTGDVRNGFDGYFDFVREFEMRGISGNEPVWFEQLHIEFTVPHARKLGMPTVNRFSVDFPSREEFFVAVERMPEFRIGLQFPGYVLRVYHTGV